MLLDEPDLVRIAALLTRCRSSARRRRRWLALAASARATRRRERPPRGTPPQRADRRAAAAARDAPEGRRARRRPDRRGRTEAPTGGDPGPDRRARSRPGPASGTLAAQARARRGSGGTRNATALDNGVALPPLEAPDEVQQIIEAGNSIARTPYKWGGGHGKWLDTGYDCSGSVSFALAAAGLIDGPMDSGRLMHWGKPGKGKWVTIYANAGPRLHGGRGHPLRHLRRARHRLALAERRCAPTPASPPATRRVSRPPPLGVPTP